MLIHYQVRCVWSGLTLTLAQTESIIASIAVPLIEQLLPNYIIFWFMSFMCLCLIIFTLTYIPETSCRHISQIEDKFARLSKVSRPSPWMTPCPSPSVTSVRKLQFKTHLFTQ